MKTLGIDLASKAEKTAACTIEWGKDGRGRVVELVRGTTLIDSALLARMRDPAAAIVAIDAPFGWPRPFVKALTQYRETGEWPLDVERRDLYLRTTDQVVPAVTSRPDEEGAEALRAKLPLSVSTDKIAIPAMRCAEIITEFKRQGGDVGRVKEVYPDAALRQWQLLPREWDTKRVGYKGKGAADRRRHLAELLADRVRDIAPLDDHVNDCAKSDDLLDAYVCALVVRAIEIGLTLPIPPEHAEIAREEGWIHLPERSSLPRFRRPR